MKSTLRILVLTLALALLISAVPAMAADISIDESHFPDAVFRDYVRTEFDANGDGFLSSTERKNARKIALFCFDYDTTCTSLEGIGYLTGLRSLEVEGLKADKVDLRKNTALTSVSLYAGDVKALNVTKNRKLTHLAVEYNKNGLTELDLSKNRKLTHLYLHDNRLTHLDVSRNTALKYLDVGANKLTELDISANKSLVYLDCCCNRLTRLVVKNNKKLKHVDCSRNKLRSINVRNNKSLRGLAVHGNRKLKKLDIAGCTRLQDAVRNKKLQRDVDKGVKCWGVYYEAETIEGLAVSDYTKVVAGKKTLYKGK